MVQLLLSGTRGNGLGTARVACILLLLLAPAWASRKPKDKLVEPGAPPDLLLEGGRKLSYERSFHSEREVKPKSGFGEELGPVCSRRQEFHSLIRPYSVVSIRAGASS